MSCQKKSVNSKKCNCTCSGCPRYGICCECIVYHNKKGQFPACMFSKNAEATWDRSFEMLKKDREKTLKN